VFSPPPSPLGHRPDDKFCPEIFRFFCSLTCYSLLSSPYPHHLFFFPPFSSTVSLYFLFGASDAENMYSRSTFRVLPRYLSFFCLILSFFSVRVNFSRTYLRTVQAFPYFTLTLIRSPLSSHSLLPVLLSDASLLRSVRFPSFTVLLPKAC